MQNKPNDNNSSSSIRSPKTTPKYSEYRIKTSPQCHCQAALLLRQWHVLSIGTRAAWMSGAQAVNHPDKSSQSSMLLRPPRRIQPRGLSRTARGRFATGPQPCFFPKVGCLLCHQFYVSSPIWCACCVAASRPEIPCHVFFHRSGLGLNRA